MGNKTVVIEIEAKGLKAFDELREKLMDIVMAEKELEKQLRAIALNPTSLKYVREEDGEEIEVSLERVRELGEEDAGFRRSVVTSEETMATIVDTSIRELRKIRNVSQDDRHKIICSAMNFDHCIQVTAAYRARGLRAAYVHSRRDLPVNEKIMQRLDNHELDVIVQVKKLGEGFDHPYLSVAAVCSIFSSLSSFVQFLGRIRRVVEKNDIEHPSNQGTVVFHAGGNIASRWEDFREFSEADQEYFAELLPVDFEFGDEEEIEIEPSSRASTRS